MGAFYVNVLHTTHQDIMYFSSYFVCSTEEPSISFVVRPYQWAVQPAVCIFFSLLSVSYLIAYITIRSLPLLSSFMSLPLPAGSFFDWSLSQFPVSLCVCIHCVDGHGCCVWFVQRHSPILLPSVPWACFVVELKLMIL